MNRRDALPISNFRLPNERARGSIRQSAIGNRKFINYVVSRGWLHLILLCGVGIFIFPFVWMVGTSMKTDDEVTDTRWMPAIPRFVPRSPFVLTAPDIIKPMPVEPVVWNKLYDRLLNLTRSAVGEHLKTYPGSANVDFAAYRDSAAAVVMNR